MINTPRIPANRLRLPQLSARRLTRLWQAVRAFALSTLSFEIVWLAGDPMTEAPRRADGTPIFDPKYGVPLRCVSCNAHAMHGLPRCFECQTENLRRTGGKFLPAVLAILCVVVPFALCVLHAKGLVKW